MKTKLGDKPMNRGTEIKNTEFATKRLTHWRAYLLLVYKFLGPFFFIYVVPYLHSDAALVKKDC